MGKYKMIQIPEAEYFRLKEFCKEHDKKLGPTVARLIREQLHTTIQRNILKVR